MALASTLLSAACQRGQADPARERVHTALPSASAAAPFKVSYLKAEGQLGPGRGTLIVDIKPPTGGRLTQGAPLVVRSKNEHLKLAKDLRAPLKKKDLPLHLPIDVVDGAMGPAELEVSYYWCTTGDSASCRPERARLFIDLDLSGSAAGGEAHLSYAPTLL